MKPQRINLCECGCGGFVRPGNRFIVAHNLLHISEESERIRRAKISIAGKGKKYPGRKLSNEHRANIGRGVREAVEKNGGGFNGGWYHTDEWKEENSERHKGNRHALGYRHTKEWKENNSKLHKGKKYPGRIQTEESNSKRSETLKGRTSPMKGRHQPEEAKKRIGAAQKGNSHALGYKHTAKWKADNSERQKRMWSDPKHHKEQQSKMARGARLSRPNKAESHLLKVLESIQPGGWKYVGDGDLIIAGKNPDFVHNNGKLLLELFGTHWHRNDSPRKRMGVFRPYGWRTLVIWERELDNQKALAAKINRFVNR